MFNYEKLFADGNVVGIRDGIVDRVFIEQIFYGTVFNGEVNVSCYKNEFLAYNETTIEYVIKLDDNGNVTEKLFDRKRDMSKRPELKNNMFVKTMWYSANTKEFSFTSITGLCMLIKKNNSLVFDMVYQNGLHDYTSNLLEKTNNNTHNGICIVKIYGDNCECFNDCKCLTPIWRHPAYKEQLVKNNLKT